MPFASTESELLNCASPGTTTLVTVPVVTENGVENASPGISTVPVVSVSAVMNRVNSGIPMFLGHATQKSVPLLSAAATACSGLENALTAATTASAIHVDRRRTLSIA